MKVLHNIELYNAGSYWEAGLTVSLPESFLSKFTGWQNQVLVGEELAPDWGYSADETPDYRECKEQSIYGSSEEEAERFARQLLDFYLNQIRVIKGTVAEDSENNTDFTEI